MDKEEIKDYIRDKEIVDRAIKDEGNDEFNDPVSMLNPFPSKESCHEHHVYKDAWRESRDSK